MFRGARERLSQAAYMVKLKMDLAEIR